MSLFFIVIIALGYVFSYVYDSPAILYIAVIFSVGMNIVSYWYSDTITLKTSGAVPADKDRYTDLYEVTENLAITAGLPMPKLYIVNDPAPNAFATGRDKDHAAIAVTSGLLSMLDRNELEGVISHEMSHIGNRDTLLQTIVVVLVGFIALLSNFFLRMGMFRGGNRRDNGNIQLIGLAIGIILAILSPIAAVLIQLAISRKREFLADASGALLTRYPEGLANALRKISAYSGTTLMHASHATAHLYISDPYPDTRTKKKSGLAKLFMTHPPVEERIAALLGQKV
jgi:heat shock protein HtpX